VALDHPAAVGKKMGDDVRLVESRILGLHVENGGPELDVVVEAHLRAPKARPLHFGV